MSIYGLTLTEPIVIITRGLSEMTCIGTAYGASPLTFLGLSGVGDLFLTCSSSNSRNYTVGYRLGQGEKLDVIMKTLGSVAEGVSTTKGVKKITEELGINAPIANSVSKAGLPDCSQLIACRFMRFYSTVSVGVNSART
jgi:glycerol-3-phosphate dehydrogenase